MLLWKTGVTFKAGQKKQFPLECVIWDKYWQIKCRSNSRENTCSFLTLRWTHSLKWYLLSSACNTFLFTHLSVSGSAPPSHSHSSIPNAMPSHSQQMETFVVFLACRQCLVLLTKPFYCQNKTSWIFFFVQILSRRDVLKHQSCGQ